MPKSRDFWAGLTFVAIGVFAVLLAPAEKGSIGQMAAGYFPTLLGYALSGIGVILTMRGFTRGAQSDHVSRTALRPLLVLLAVVAFALLLERAGLVIAIFALLAIAALAGRGFTLKQFALLSAVLFALVFAVFVWALRMPVRLW
jgi:hypothetical protein